MILVTPPPFKKIVVCKTVVFQSFNDFENNAFENTISFVIDF
jgi:hypothetical protein